MSFISDDEYRKRIDSPENLINIVDGVVNSEGERNKDKGVSEKEINSFIRDGMIINSGEKRNTGVKGKVLGDKNVPDVIRDVITIQGNFEKKTEVAKHWGVSPATVSNLANGTPNRGNPDAISNQRAQAVIEDNVSKIRRVVEKRILSALEYLTSDKLEEVDAKDLSIIVKNLSGVAGGLEKKDQSGPAINVQTIFYNPGTKTVNEYEVIDG